MSTSLGSYIKNLGVSHLWQSKYRKPMKRRARMWFSQLSSRFSTKYSSTLLRKIPTLGANLFTCKIHRIKAVNLLCFSSILLRLGSKGQQARMCLEWRMVCSSWSIRSLPIHTSTTVWSTLWHGMAFARLKVLLGILFGQRRLKLSKWRSLMSTSTAIISQALGN